MSQITIWDDLCCPERSDEWWKELHEAIKDFKIPSDCKVEMGPSVVLTSEEYRELMGE